MNTTKLSHNTGYSYKVRSTMFYAMAMGFIFTVIIFQPTLISPEKLQHVVGSNDSKIIAYFISFSLMLLCALTSSPAEFIALAKAIIFSPVVAFFVTWVSDTECSNRL